MKIETRKYLFLAMVLLNFLSLQVHAQENGVHFEKDLSWEQIKAKAKASHKYIFVDVFATGDESCKWMDNEVFESSKVGEFIGSKFIAVKIQGDSTKSDKDQVKSWYATAVRMKNEFRTMNYPAFLFFSPEGQLVHKFNAGAVADTSFMAIAKNALNPDKQYVSILKKYKEGRLGFAQMPYLVKNASQLHETDIAKMVSTDYIDTYLFKLKEQELFTKENLTFMSQYLNDTESKAFKLFMKYSEKVNAVLGKDKAEYALRATISNDYLRGIEPEKKPNFDWFGLKNTIKSKFGEIGLEAMYGKQMGYYKNAEDWNNFGKYFVLYFEKALKRPEYMINNIAWTVFEKVEDQKVLECAIGVMKYDIETWDQQAADAHDTYANLLYKAGKKELAIEWEEKALKLSRNNKEILETLEKMRNGQQTWPEAVVKP